MPRTWHQKVLALLEHAVQEVDLDLELVISPGHEPNGSRCCFYRLIVQRCKETTAILYTTADSDGFLFRIGLPPGLDLYAVPDPGQEEQLQAMLTIFRAAVVEALEKKEAK